MINLGCKLFNQISMRKRPSSMKFMGNSIENRLVRRREVKEYNEVLTILTQTRREIENDSFMMVA